MSEEIWKAIIGYEGRYEVSSLGQVKSLPKTNEKGRVYQGILKGRPARHGYLRVALFKNLVRKNESIHRIVATAFCDKPDGANEVNHKNAIKTDNRAENLEWVTRRGNMRHAYETGRLTHINTLVLRRWGRRAESASAGRTGILS